MKVGDLVSHTHVYADDSIATGIIVEFLEQPATIPPACKVLWVWGEIWQHWTDDLEVINDGSSSKS